MNYTLNVSYMHYNQLRQFLSTDNDHMNHSTTLIDTVVCHDSPACWKLLNHWSKTLTDTKRLNTWLPSIKRLFISNANYCEFMYVEPLLVPLVSVNNMLQHLHLVFERPTHWYPTILSALIRHRISTDTMILEVEKGHEYRPHPQLAGLHQMEPLHWPNTTRLTLSIQQSSELILLFKRDALPAIEHLSITNEDVRTALPSRKYLLVPNIHLCDYNLREIADGSHLRSLILRYVTLSDTIILLDSLVMPVLEKLILIDLYDQTIHSALLFLAALDRVAKFQELCNSTHLSSVKKLHFSLCFPQEMEQAWHMHSFNYNVRWPFGNLVCRLDEISIFNTGTFSFISKTFFVVYTFPINTILQHKRTLHNHHFAAHASVPIIASQRRSLEMTYNQTDEPVQLVKTLQIVANNRIKKLEMTYSGGQISSQLASTCCRDCNLLLQHLRSISFDFTSNSIERTIRTAIVKQILDYAPNLSQLTVDWKDFRHCERTYFNLKYVCLLLDRCNPEPKCYFNIQRLTELAPHLRSLETSIANIVLNENAVEVVLLIIRHFDQLIYLTLNKNGLYPAKQEMKDLFKEKLLLNGHDQLFDCNNIRIKFSLYNELSIWL
ncbi:unnamed protein product [Adineta ricciae]|uniref:Uncharacterized protein n=1 Tax=Adineta ricciae TaxID=249248 RepID=A0A815LQZ5_ADIRI|nr:unnamed protein product [Adineta ricciae]